MKLRRADEALSVSSASARQRTASAEMLPEAGDWRETAPRSRLATSASRPASPVGRKHPRQLRRERALLCERSGLRHGGPRTPERLGRLSPPAPEPPPASRAPTSSSPSGSREARRERLLGAFDQLLGPVELVALDVDPGPRRVEVRGPADSRPHPTAPTAVCELRQCVVPIARRGGLRITGVVMAVAKGLLHPEPLVDPAGLRSPSRVLSPDGRCRRAPSRRSDARARGGGCRASARARRPRPPRPRTPQPASN